MADQTPVRRAASRASRDTRPSAGATERTPRPRAGVGAKRRHPVRTAVIIVLAIMVVLAGAVAGAFVWLRWFSADDGADMQGTWYLAGTSTPITITEDRIQLTDEVSYHYTLDPETKTFELDFGNLKGGGRYRFSLDRDEVALVDGRFTGSDTLSADVGWTVQALIGKLQGNELSPEVRGEAGVTLLSRTPASSIPSAVGVPSVSSGAAGASSDGAAGSGSAGDGAGGDGADGSGTGSDSDTGSGSGSGTAAPNTDPFDAIEDR